MLKKILNFIPALLFLSAHYGISQDEGLTDVLKPGEELIKISGEFSFTEGPAADKKGNVYFTDQPSNRIMLWNSNNGLSTFMQPAGRSNGMFFDNRGNLWSCADEKNELWCISPGKEVEVILNKYDGKLLNGPNDVWVAPDGRIYFTDPFYKRSWWDHSEMPQDKQCVYLLDSDHKILKRVEETLVMPNGIVGTSDGKTIYVADAKGSKTWVYSVNADGTLADKKLFCEMGSDGMTIDNKGNIYLTGKGVTVFDRTGRKLGTIAVPEGWTSNVCFGGKNRKTLFITASKGFYMIRTRTKGVF